jgi:hypothetical protein
MAGSSSGMARVWMWRMWVRRSSRYEEKPTLILARSSPPSRGSCRLELRSTLQVIGPEAYRASSSHPGPKLTMGFFSANHRS